MPADCSITPMRRRASSACGGRPNSSALARIGVAQAQQQADRRALARAVGAQQCQHLAARSSGPCPSSASDLAVGLADAAQAGQDVRR